MKHLVLLAMLAGCAAPRGHYLPISTFAPASDSAAQLEPSDLAMQVALGRVQIPAEVQVPPSLLWIAWLPEYRVFRGAEIDVWGDGQPWTLYVDLTGQVTAHVGPKAAPHDPPAQRDELVKTYGLAGISDGDVAWTPQELAYLATALGTLDSREIVALQGMIFERASVSSFSAARDLAEYDPISVPARIRCYDLAFVSTSLEFVGPLDAPVAPAVLTLTHEIGHAIADWPLRHAWSRVLTAEDPDALREARAHRRSVSGRGPVIDRWRQVYPGRRWPTMWVQNVHEGFAESFGLWKTDRQALLRLSPSVTHWFDSGEHLVGLPES